MAALEELCRDILARHAIPARHVVGHSDVAPHAQAGSGRAVRLAAPRARRHRAVARRRATPARARHRAEMQRLLAAIGYDIPVRRARRAHRAGPDRVPAPFPPGALRRRRRRRDAAADRAGRGCGLTCGRSDPYIAPPDGRMAAFRRKAGRGKSGLHGNTVPGNARRGRPQGKCHRNIPPTRSLRAGRQG